MWAPEAGRPGILPRVTDAALMEPATDERLIEAGFEPVGPVVAALRHPLLLVVPLVVMVLAALAVGLARSPVYSAEARLSVGRVNVPAYTLQSVIQGNATLAAGYARAISAGPVIARAAKVAGVSPATARSVLSASQIPETTLIRVEATAPDRGTAVALANGGGQGLISYVTQLNSDPGSAAVIAQYDKTEAHIQSLEYRLSRLPAHAGAGARRYAAGLQAEIQTARLEALDLANRYQVDRGSEPGPGTVQMLVPAATAGSDRSSVLERALLIGAAAGLVLGCALALARANWPWLRRLR